MNTATNEKSAGAANTDALASPARPAMGARLMNNLTPIQRNLGVSKPGAYQRDLVFFAQTGTQCRLERVHKDTDVTYADVTSAFSPATIRAALRNPKLAAAIKALAGVS